MKLIKFGSWAIMILSAFYLVSNLENFIVWLLSIFWIVYAYGVLNIIYKVEELNRSFRAYEAMTKEDNS
jgi:hypothetical protein